MLKKKGVLRLIYEKNKPLPRLMPVFIKERFLTGATIAELGLCLLYKLKLNKSILKCSFSEQRCKPLQKKLRGCPTSPSFCHAHPSPFTEFSLTGVVSCYSWSSWCSWLRVSWGGRGSLSRGLGLGCWLCSTGCTL